MLTTEWVLKSVVVAVMMIVGTHCCDSVQWYGKVCLASTVVCVFEEEREVSDFLVVKCQ